MSDAYLKNVIEAALLAAGRPVPVSELQQIFDEHSRPTPKELRAILEALSADYEGRGVAIKETANGFRFQVRTEFAQEVSRLWPDRPKKYSRAMLETLALIAYRQPITRAEIEEVRGVVVSTNIVRTLLERNWIRVVGHRDVPGKPAMFGTTKEFLDYFGLKKLEELPTLAEIKDGMPELSPQTDLIESLVEADAHGVEAVLSEDEDAGDGTSLTVVGTVPEASSRAAEIHETGEFEEGDSAADDADLAGPDLISDESEEDASREGGTDEVDDADVQSADVIPLRASDDDQ